MLRTRGSRLAVLLLACVVAACATNTGGGVQPDPDLVTVEVAAVATDPRTGTPVVLLREPASERMVPIWIGAPEADAISRALHGVEVPRPMTHDLLASTVQGLGARVEEVVIHEQRAGTYYGVIRIATGARGRVEIDSRPSDGVALALRTGAPIRVSRSLFVDSPEHTAPPRVVPTV
jgi:uncharacterized protein